MPNIINNKYEVLTENGFQDFAGIKQTARNEGLKLTFSDNSILECTSEHQIKMMSGWINACNINIGDITVNELSVIKIEEQVEEKKYYDLLNVSNGHEYITNNIISHNCAFIPPNVWDEFYKSVYPTISSGKETKIILVSTVNKLNHFYRLVQGARRGIENGGNAFKLQEIIWSDVPGRDEQWKAETIANTSLDDFRQEHENLFIGGTGTLLSYNALKKLEHAILDPTQEQGGLKVYKQPAANHRYVITVDVSRGVLRDYSTFSVIDISELPYKQVATFRRNDISTLLLPTVIYSTAQKYNNAFVLIENNDVGHGVIERLNYDLEYENILSVKSKAQRKFVPGIRTTPVTKLIGCNRIKELIETDLIEIYDKETVNEFNSFIENKTSFAAEEGRHDDMVMTLVLFGFLSTTDQFKDITTADYVQRFLKIKENEFEEIALPLPIIDDGFEYDEDDIIDQYEIENSKEYALDPYGIDDGSFFTSGVDYIDFDKFE